MRFARARLAWRVHLDTNGSPWGFGVLLPCVPALIMSQVPESLACDAMHMHMGLHGAPTCTRMAASEASTSMRDASMVATVSPTLSTAVIRA
jgi:hypothetical protein